MLEKFKGKAAAVGAALAAPVLSAHAALDTDISSALNGMGTDASGAAKLVLLAIVAVVAIKFIRRGF